MYNERRDSFSIKRVILQFLFIALFVFLLVWLFPTKSYVSNINGGENLDVFYDRIFNENVIAMKDSAKSYFTTPRLPQKVGDKVTMTLGQMLEKKIILPFVDKDGKTCSLTESYVEITKYDEEYVMKVNLKCSEQENYLLVYMGCYDYCSTTICEKNESDIKTPVIYPTKTEPTPEKPQPTPDSTPDPKPIVTPTTPSCNLKVLSGEKYGNGYTGKVVVGFASKNSGNNASLTGYGLGTSTNYNGNNEFTLSTNGKHKVYGYVKNSFGNTAVCSIDVTIEEKKTVVKPTPTTPSCSLKIVSGEKYDGAYTGTVVVGFASKNSGDNASLTGYGLGTSTNYNGDYNYVINKVGTHKIYGYVKNSFGNTAVCSIDVTIKEKAPEVTPTKPSCSLKVVSGEKYDGAYTGTVVVGFASKNSGDNATLVGYGLGTKTNYSGNTSYSVAKVGTHKIYGYVKNSFGNTAVCSINVTIKEKKEEVKEYEWEYAKSLKVCSDWSSWSNWSTTYVEPNDLREVSYRKVKVTKIVGYKKTTYKDTSKPIYDTREVAVGKLTQKVCTEYGYVQTGNVAYTDWVYEGYVTTTSTLKNTALEKYVPVTDTETLCQQYCSSTTGHVYKKYTRKALNEVVYTCKNTTTVEKLITAQKTVVVGYETYTVTEPIKETEIVTQYKYRTRTCETKSDVKWSYYNDKNLLNSGYKYTGNKRPKK